MKRFAIYISGKSGRLKKIINEDVNVNKWLKLVLSDEKIDEDLKRLLTKRDIIVDEIEYEKIGTRVDEKRVNMSNFLLEKMIQNEIDYCFSFGKHILVGDILKRYENKIINFHPSILPLYKGENAIDQAIEVGNNLLIGNTAHFIDQGIDTGLVIMQSVIPLQSFYETESYDVILDLQIVMLKKLLSIIEENRITVQDDRVIIKDADYRSYGIYPRI